MMRTAWTKVPIYARVGIHESIVVAGTLKCEPLRRTREGVGGVGRGPEPAAVRTGRRWQQITSLLMQYRHNLFDRKAS